MSQLTTGHLLRRAKDLADGSGDREFRQVVRQIAAAADARELLSLARIVDSRTTPPPADRRIRVALAGSFTTDLLGRILRMALLRCGVDAQVDVHGIGQYGSLLADPSSELHLSAPDFVVLAVHHDELGLPADSADPDREVAAEVARWRALWDRAAGPGGARVVHWLFALPDDLALSSFSAQQPGSRYRMARQVNAALADAANPDVLVVDCERLASSVGAASWFDRRTWRLAKQPMATEVLPLLATETAGLIAADLGLSKKCLVLDLDNTVWGGTIGEDGLDGLVLGGDAGEGHLDLQRLALRLRDSGIVLAVCSKNNPEDARLPFREHPDMLLTLDDISVFSAGWEPKAVQLRRIAEELGIGVDALVLVDDDPVERAQVRELLPEVDVVDLPASSGDYAHTLRRYPLLWQVRSTEADAGRADSYRARAAAGRLLEESPGLDDFYRSLAMTGAFLPVDDISRPRAVQLLMKTNQFNVTTRRHTAAELDRLLAEPGAVHFTARLTDRFTAHGLVGLLLARRTAEVLAIDTWLLSCRVIGRTVEDSMFHTLAERAAATGARAIEGSYLPTAKNVPVAELYRRLGFDLVRSDPDGATHWRYDLSGAGRPARNPFITEGQ
ncbi:HAD-IIIC family phosphatase [Streptomyces sp. XY431]|uniref:HAD-IIIC family phosphatase n=1 Tax=Streptomyces sp. XY431 TaxID=1415562 RepID=UPI0006ADF66C|nr:HAD-IIIC family phosphatase [Streptomyces sp. XY431]